MPEQPAINDILQSILGALKYIEEHPNALKSDELDAYAILREVDETLWWIVS